MSASPSLARRVAADKRQRRPPVGRSPRGLLCARTWHRLEAAPPACCREISAHERQHSRLGWLPDQTAYTTVTDTLTCWLPGEMGTEAELAEAAGLKTGGPGLPTGVMLMIWPSCSP